MCSRHSSSTRRPRPIHLLVDPPCAEEQESDKQVSKWEHESHLNRPTARLQDGPKEVLRTCLGTALINDRQAQHRSLQREETEREREGSLTPNAVSPTSERMQRASSELPSARVASPCACVVRMHPLDQIASMVSAHTAMNR